MDRGVTDWIGRGGSEQRAASYRGPWDLREPSLTGVSHGTVLTTFKNVFKNILEDNANQRRRISVENQTPSTYMKITFSLIVTSKIVGGGGILPQQ